MFAAWQMQAELRLAASKARCQRDRRSGIDDSIATKHATGTSKKTLTSAKRFSRVGSFKVTPAIAQRAAKRIVCKPKKFNAPTSTKIASQLVAAQPTAEATVLVAVPAAPEVHAEPPVESPYNELWTPLATEHTPFVDWNLGLPQAGDVVLELSRAETLVGMPIAAKHTTGAVAVPAAATVPAALPTAVSVPSAITQTTADVVELY